MASKTNKYTSINFNDLFDKKNPNPNTNPNLSSSISKSSKSNQSPSFSFPHKTPISSSRSHNGMLVLTRPQPKPKPQPQSQSQSQPQPQPSFSLPQPTVQPDQTRSEPDPISLRPLGKTGVSPPPVQQTKSDRFVPPHLRQGFVSREEGPGPEDLGFRGNRNRVGNLRSPHRYGEVSRPKSGGGYERGWREGEMIRPTSGGKNRPSSSGL